ncbi:MAG: NUDIX pyrophosphatase, partial [Candidatus Zixiibacteriota bacterium]
WPKDLYVIPQYFFAVAMTGCEISLSEEHTEYQWGSYEKTLARLHWESNRTALWELHERLLEDKLEAVD